MRTAPVILALLLVSVLSWPPLAAAQPSTAFTYQGYLEDGGAPADGAYDFRFTLYDDRDTGTLIAGPVTSSSVSVAEGLYDVQVDFGGAPGLWEGARWLEVEARPSGGSFTTLGPRTELLAVPRAQALPGLRTSPAADATWGASTNVEGGWAGNTITAGVVAATVSGGGSEDSGTLYPNRVTDHYGTVGGGQANRAGDDDGILHDARYGTVSGGANNTASGFGATISGGVGSTASGQWATVGGGTANAASADYATVGGGDGNAASVDYATVGGGSGNMAKADYATVGGGSGNEASSQLAGVGSGVGNVASGLQARIGGGNGNAASGSGATVGGGEANTASGLLAHVGGGSSNEASGETATVGGGNGNTASGDFTTVSGGEDHTANAENATIGGGFNSTASGRYSTISGGYGHTASNFTATVGGGHTNVASGQYATVPGGRENQAGGYASFAGGTFGKVRSASEVGGGDTDGDEGTFLWADNSSFSQFISDGPDQFLVRASGGTTFYSDTQASTGVRLNPGSGSWTSASSRALKTDFAPLDVHAVLRSVARLDLQSWRYRTEPVDVRHLGPVAEEFYALFGLGRSAETIATVDADGVALAAIQALHEQLRQQQAEIERLRAEIDTLRAER
ncbi:MAG: hypothetical protein GVY18_17500 [Bacteroidetes bacterium]|jgi:hypothetical protein|nr:hypothetical protein [Bacteroidota bacterium]